MILADVTIGCQSNDRRVSSISDLLAPAVKAAPTGPPSPPPVAGCAAVQASAPPNTPTAG